VALTVAAPDIEEAEMANEAHFSVIGFVATQPRTGVTKNGSPSVSMRVGWTPRSFDRDAGVWSDQPSSFVTVQCYKKVAEHASVCLRKGDPIVARGTIRVREYVDQNGQRRSSVEVVADSIGHDLSRGVSLFNKTPARLEQTAYEYEQSMAAEAGRAPLPGDARAADRDGAPERIRDVEDDAENDDADEEPELADDHELESADPQGPEFALGAESATGELMADVDSVLDPVGAAS
jgi:single-strand DNA-binding protein